MGRYRIIFLTILAAIFIAAPLSADRIGLKNGGSIEGIIEKENEKTVEVNIGFGTIILGRSQIKNIERSSGQDSRDMAANWEKKRQELALREKEFEEEREKRFKEASRNWIEDAREKRQKEEGEGKFIQIARDQTTKGIVVEALLNDTVKANLILDTGASIIALSRDIGKALGVDLSDTKSNMVEMRLADGRKTIAKALVLDSVKIQDIEVRNVMAAIMLEEAPIRGAGDGLLGMSFLSKFNFKTDLKNMKMTLEKIAE